MNDNGNGRSPQRARRTQRICTRDLWIGVFLAAAFPLKARAAESWTRQSAPAAGLSRLEVSAAAGKLTVTAKKGAKTVEVSVVGKDPEKRCELVFETRGSALHVEAKTAGLLPFHACPLGFSITAPAALDVSVADGAGNIELEGFAGQTDVKDGAGNVRLKDLRGRVSADTGAGTVEGRLAAGEVDIKTGAGSVALVWPKGGANRVTVRAGTGSVSLGFPKGTRVDAELSTGIGSVHNAFAEEKGAPTSVLVNTGVGSISLIEQ